MATTSSPPVLARERAIRDRLSQAQARARHYPRRPPPVRGRQENATARRHGRASVLGWSSGASRASSSGSIRGGPGGFRAGGNSRRGAASPTDPACGGGTTAVTGRTRRVTPSMSRSATGAAGSESPPMEAVAPAAAVRAPEPATAICPSRASMGRSCNPALSVAWRGGALPGAERPSTGKRQRSTSGQSPRLRQGDYARIDQPSARMAAG